MNTNRLFAVGTVLTAGLLAAMVQAGDAPRGGRKDDAEARRAEVVGELAQAARLAAFGRGEMAEETGLTGFKSPEALVSAGGILLRANASFGGKMDPLGIDPTDEAGKPIKAEDAKLPGLKAEAEALFDEARALAAGDRAKAAAIEALIKEASTFESRGAVGFPRSVQKAIPPGGHHWYKIPFVPGAPAAIAIRSTGNSKLQFEILNNAGGRMFNLKGAFAQYQWMPARGKEPKMITVNIYNIGTNPTAYQMVTN